MVDKNSITQDLNHLRQWISKQPHLPQEHDDVWLEKFLRGCKYRTEKCKETIDMYYTARTAIPEFFSNRDPTSEEVLKVSKLIIQLYLPKTTPEGYTVWISDINNYYTEFDLPDAGMKRHMMLFDAHLVLESSIDYVFIYNAEHDTISSSTKTTPSYLKKFLFALKSRPVRFKEFHVINAPAVFSTVVNMGKSFMREKMKNRVFVHAGGMEELHKYVPREILPLEYGGDAGSIKDINEECQQKLEKLRPWFLAEESKKTDESLRVKKNSVYDDIFGVDGTFKQLNVD